MVTSVYATALLGIFLIYLPIAKYSRIPLLSPVVIHLTWGFSTIAFAFIYYFTFNEKYNLLGVDEVGLNTFLTPLHYYFVSYSSLLCGFISLFLLFKNRSRYVFRHKLTINSQLSNLPQNINYIVPTIILLVLIIGSIFFIYGYGVFQRETYLLDNSSSMQTLLMLECLLFVASNTLLSRDRSRLAGLLGILFYLFILTTGSRRVFLYLLFNFSLSLVTKKRGLLWVGAWICILIIFLGYLLTLRSQDMHGLVPYLINYKFDASEIIDRVIYSAYYMLAYSYFVTANTIDVFKNYYDIGYTFIAINPLPGVWAGWYKIANDVRLNIFAPFNTFGELFTAGKTITILYFYILGMIYCYIEYVVRSLIIKKQLILAIVIYTVLLFSIVLEHQYNLRASTRFVYYSIFLAFLVIGTNTLLSQARTLKPKLQASRKHVKAH